MNLAPTVMNASLHVPQFWDGRAEDRKQLADFLKALSGDPDVAYVAAPKQLESGPNTPAPDPN
jgi:hypothetical protein